MLEKYYDYITIIKSAKSIASIINAVSLLYATDVCALVSTAVVLEGGGVVKKKYNFDPKLYDGLINGRVNERRQLCRRDVSRNLQIDKGSAALLS